MDNNKNLQEILNAFYIAKEATKVSPTLPNHINNSHLHVLTAINELGEEVRITDISKKLLMTLPNITVWVKDLENLGLVKKTTLKIDKRVILVRLTDEGFNVLNKYVLDYRHRISKVLETKDMNNYKIITAAIAEIYSIFRNVADDINNEIKGDINDN